MASRERSTEQSVRDDGERAVRPVNAGLEPPPRLIDSSVKRVAALASWWSIGIGVELIPGLRPRCASERTKVPFSETGIYRHGGTCRVTESCRGYAGADVVGADDGTDSVTAKGLGHSRRLPETPRIQRRVRPLNYPRRIQVRFRMTNQVEARHGAVGGIV